MASAVMHPLDDHQEDKPIDREKCCPLLLRVFLSQGRHHQTSEFVRGHVPPNELQIYTWMDATLKELTTLVKEVNPDSRRKGTLFDFALIFPVGNHPAYRIQEIGSTCSGQKGADDGRTLAQAGFQVGDYLDISISVPPAGGGGGGGGNGGGGQRGGHQRRQNQQKPQRF